jgi:hypothetical protein
MFLIAIKELALDALVTPSLNTVWALTKIYMKNKKLAWGLAIASIGVTVLRMQSAEFVIAVASAVLGTKRACQCDYSM